MRRAKVDEMVGKEGRKSGEKNVQLPSAGTQLRTSLANVNMANLEFHRAISLVFWTGRHCKDARFNAWPLHGRHGVNHVQGIREMRGRQ